MTWFILGSKYYVLVGATPAKACPQPRLLQDTSNDNNIDESQNASVENEFGGGTFAFTSSHDLSENNGVCKNSTEFTRL